MDAILLSFAVVFIAEFGDKSQLLILAFATRYSARPVILGLLIGAALIQGVSVVIGAIVGAALPDAVVGIVSGLAFLAVAAWTVLGDDEDDEATDASRVPRTGLAVVLAVAGTFLLAELGDKTMLATFALAASQGALPTWIGSTAGEVAANLIAVVVGRQVGQRLSPRLVRVGSAATFAAVGAVILAAALSSLMG